MKPYNLAERNRKIVLFAAVYLAAVSLYGGLCYLLLRAAPQEQRRVAALTQDKIEAFLAHTDQADSLVVQVQKAGHVAAGKLVPFYKWSQDLKTVYHQPFYAVVVNSYTDLVNDIKKGTGQDSATASLRDKMITLQEENLKLKTGQKNLQKDLREAKSKKSL